MAAVRVTLSIRQVGSVSLLRDQACGLYLGSSTTSSHVFGVLAVVVAVYADIL